MSQLVFLPSNAVQTAGRQLFTTSLLVAEIFEKRHDNVLRSIDELDCSDGYRLLNFGATFRTIPGPNNAARQERYFEMTKDGFTFLVMGYTGAKAAQFKEAYIARFNEMETALRQRDNAGLTAISSELAKLRADVAMLKRQNRRPAHAADRKSQHDKIRDKVAAYVARQDPSFASVEQLGRQILHKASLTPEERTAILAGLRQMGYGYPSRGG